MVLLLQVLIDTILQLEDVIRFRASMEQQSDIEEAEPAQQQPHAADSRSARYVTQLLSRVTYDQLLLMLHWGTEDWAGEFNKCYQAIPLLLDLVEREVTQPEAPTDCYLLAEQQLNEVCWN